MLKSFGKSENFKSLFFTAEVVSAADESCTVKVGTTTLNDVRTGAVINGVAANLRIKPKVASMVLVADLSGGGMSDLAVIGWSEVDTIVINGGANEGLVKVKELTEKLNNLKTEFNSFVSTYNTHTHSVSTAGTAATQTGLASATTAQAQSATAFNKDDYQNDKIKH